MMSSLTSCLFKMYQAFHGAENFFSAAGTGIYFTRTTTSCDNGIGCDLQPFHH
jgi:hypothetical protein